MTQITICLVLFVAMLVLFFTNKLPMSFTALGAMILLVFTGCLDAKTAGRDLRKLHSRHHGGHVRGGRRPEPHTDDQPHHQAAL